MPLSQAEFRRLEYLVEANRVSPLSIAEGDELRQILMSEDANASLMDWPQLVAFAEAIVHNRGFIS